MTNMEKVMLTALKGVVSVHDAQTEDSDPYDVLESFGDATDVCRHAIRIAEAEDNKERDKFTLYADGFGMKASDFGKLFMFRKRSYRITGCSPNSHTYPIHGARVPDGKTFKFRAKDVVAMMARVA